MGGGLARSDPNTCGFQRPRSGLARRLNAQRSLRDTASWLVELVLTDQPRADGVGGPAQTGTARRRGLREVRLHDGPYHIRNDRGSHWVLWW